MGERILYVDDDQSILAACKRILHYLLWTTTGANHFTDGLLCVNRGNPVARSLHRSNMAWSCQANAIAKSKAGLQSEANGSGMIHGGIPKRLGECMGCVRAL